MTSLMSHRTNLPAQVSSFIGRERELEEITHLLRSRRLITLTGSGGTGKTRLALHAAATELDEFTDGVWLVELASLAVPEFAIDTVAKVVAAPEVHTGSPLESLATFLNQKRLLLVLDNCEHLLAECAHLVAHLLARCQSLVVLATSREPLAIDGEWVLRVPPLSLPPSFQMTEWEHLPEYDAIRLFIERAQAAEPSFHLSRVTAAPIVEICRQLDGVPLALELAAGRVRGMGVAYLGARLDDRFRLLTGGDRTSEPRQRTLLALVDWSYALLSERERVILRRLSIFSGSFALEAAESVCSGAYACEHGQGMVSADIVIDDLARLVDKSLVQLDHETARFRLLETIRLYGSDRLVEAGEADDISRQHFDYYLQLAEDGAVYVGGYGEEAWFTRLDQEHDNFRAALDWVIQTQKAIEATRMALRLWKFWHVRTYLREGLRWLEQIQALDAIRPLPLELRPRLLNALGVLAQRAHYFDRARAYHAEALRLWTAADDAQGMAQAHLNIGWQHWDEIELDLAATCAQESLTRAEHVGDKRLIASALLLGALVDTHIGNLDTGIPALERSLRMWRELGDMDSVASTIAILATAHQQRGEFERAKPLLLESARVQLRTRSTNLTGTLVGMMYLAVNSAATPERARDAAHMLGVLLAWDETTSAAPSPWPESAQTLKVKARLTALLGQEGFELAVATGKGLTTAGLLLLIERITAPSNEEVSGAKDALSVTPTTSFGRLTPREQEVLRLVAQGLTNAQVARALTVTPRTINAHLTAIYGKLGVSSRSGAIRYAIDHRLG